MASAKGASGPDHDKASGNLQTMGTPGLNYVEIDFNHLPKERSLSHHTNTDSRVTYTEVNPVCLPPKPGSSVSSVSSSPRSRTRSYSGSENESAYSQEKEENFSNDSVGNQTQEHQAPFKHQERLSQENFQPGTKTGFEIKNNQPGNTPKDRDRKDLPEPPRAGTLQEKRHSNTSMDTKGEYKIKPKRTSQGENDHLKTHEDLHRKDSSETKIPCLSENIHSKTSYVNTEKRRSVELASKQESFQPKTHVVAQVKERNTKGATQAGQKVPVTSKYVPAKMPPVLKMYDASPWQHSEEKPITRTLPRGNRLGRPPPPVRSKSLTQDESDHLHHSLHKGQGHMKTGKISDEQNREQKQESQDQTPKGSDQNQTSPRNEKLEPNVPKLGHGMKVDGVHGVVLRNKPKVIGQSMFYPHKQDCAKTPQNNNNNEGAHPTMFKADQNKPQNQSSPNLNQQTKVMNQPQTKAQTCDQDINENHIKFNKNNQQSTQDFNIDSHNVPPKSRKTSSLPRYLATRTKFSDSISNEPGSSQHHNKSSSVKPASSQHHDHSTSVSTQTPEEFKRSGLSTHTKKDDSSCANYENVGMVTQQYENTKIKTPVPVLTMKENTKVVTEASTGDILRKQHGQDKLKPIPAPRRFTLHGPAVCKSDPPGTPQGRSHSTSDVPTPPKKNYAWLSQLTREEAEGILKQYGKPRDFLIRESVRRTGDYCLSLIYHDRVRHYPISKTPNNLFNIGKHSFKNLANVVKYYQANTLFHDQDKGVTLGEPITITK